MSDPLLVLHGDALSSLGQLPDESVQCVVTSPPYWGLRDYGVEGQIGLEKTPDEYVARLVAILREVKRVLRSDGTLWLNLGDSYCSTAPNTNGDPIHRRGIFAGVSERRANGSRRHRSETPNGLKPKDLVGIPWRVAFALQADGWYLRSDIVWSKPNPMPESVKDRPTRSHEYIFLLTKSERYYYNAEAIAEPLARPEELDRATPAKFGGALKYVEAQKQSRLHSGNEYKRKAQRSEIETRNKRSVWSIATTPFPEAHFATFPTELPRLCILAGSSPARKQCDCDEVIETPRGSGETIDPTLQTGRAGMNRERKENEGTRPITRREQRAYAEQMKASPYRAEMATEASEAFAHYIRTDRSGARPLPERLLVEWLRHGWLTTPAPCSHKSEPDTILDPFAGSGTTGKVAIELGRKAILIEPKAEYIEMIERRCRTMIGLPFQYEATA